MGDIGAYIASHSCLKKARLDELASWLEGQGVTSPTDLVCLELDDLVGYEVLSVEVSHIHTNTHV